MKIITLVVCCLVISAATFAQNIKGPKALCVNSTATLTATPVGGKWTSGNTAFGTVNETTGLVTAIAVGTLTITYTPTGSNALTYQLDIVADASIVADQIVCVGNTSIFKGVPENGTWDKRNGKIKIDPNSGIINGLDTGSETLIYTVAGCHTPANKAITIKGGPGKITGNLNIYSGSIAELKSDSMGTWGPTNSKYASVLPTKGETTQVKGLAAGVAIITLTQDNGCSTTATVIIDPAPGSTEQKLKEILSSDEFQQTITDQVGILGLADGKVDAIVYDKKTYDKYLYEVWNTRLRMSKKRSDRKIKKAGKIEGKNTSGVADKTKGSGENGGKGVKKATRLRKRAAYLVKGLPQKPLGTPKVIDTVKMNLANGNVNYASITMHNGKIFENRDLTYNVIYNNDKNTRNSWRDAMRNKDKRRILGQKLLTTRERDSCIVLNDVVQYVPRANRSQYLPDDDVVTLVPGAAAAVPLYKNVDLNNLIDFRIYTDMLALLKKQDNGLVLSDASAKIFTRVYQNNKFYLINYISPSLTFSKFDDKLSAVNVKDSTEPMFLSDSTRAALYQLSYLRVGVKLNAAKLVYGNNYVEWNVGTDFNISNLRPNTVSGDNRTYTSWSFYNELSGQVMQYENFGLCYSIKYMAQHSLNNTGLKVYKYTDYYLIPDITVFYYTNESFTNKLFLKFRLTNLVTGFPSQGGDIFSMPANPLNSATSFFSLQVGYNARLQFKK